MARWRSRTSRTPRARSSSALRAIAAAGTCRSACRSTCTATSRRACCSPDVFYIGYREYPHIDMYETGERVARLHARRARGPAPAGDGARQAADDRQPGRRPHHRRAASPTSSRQRARLETRASPACLDLPGAALARHPGPRLRGAGLRRRRPEGGAGSRRRARRHGLRAARSARCRTSRRSTEAIRIGLSSPGLTVDRRWRRCAERRRRRRQRHRAEDAARRGRRQGRAAHLSHLVDAPAAGRRGRGRVGATVDVHARPHALDLTTASRSRSTGIVRDADRRRLHACGDEGMKGATMRMGSPAVLGVGSFRIAVRSVGGLEWDTGLFTSVGLDLRHAALVFVKSPSHFRVAFAPARGAASSSPTRPGRPPRQHAPRRLHEGEAAAPSARRPAQRPPSGSGRCTIAVGGGFTAPMVVNICRSLSL